MKKIILLSDTHHHMDDRILEHCSKADEIWHAGDIGSPHVTDQLAAVKPLRAVWGNIDNDRLRLQFPEFLSFKCESLKVVITHIGNIPGRYPEKVRSVIQNEKPDLFICGHSHVLRIMRDPVNNLLYINPGAAGHTGFHQTRTLVRFTIDGNKPVDMEVVELGKRGQSAQPVG